MDVEAFIQRWSHARGGAERANYQMFLTELCAAVGLPRPDPASDQTALNDYVFERGVKRRESEGMASTLRIDLYKKGSFILEAKQSKANQRDDQLSFFKPDETASTAAAEGRWDMLMRNARKQAEDDVFRLPADHPAPPFIIVCDVGYVFEVYADFSGSGRAYSHFPDRKGFRIRLEDLRDPKVVARLKAIWTEPQSLDPTRESARVTRQIAERLAEVSKRLEKKHPAEEVAHFLMRCIFTMFAEDVDLLPRGRFRAGTPLDEKDEDVKDRGRVLILKDLHDQIDRATMQAYGWDDLIPLLSSSSGKPLAAQTGGPSSARERDPVADTAGSGPVREQIAFGAAGSPGRFAPEDDERKGTQKSLDEIILERLVALNAERAAEEAAGHVRWLRPDYQIPRFAKTSSVKPGELDLQDTVVAIDKALPAFPKDKGEQVMAIRAVLVASGRPMDAAAVARAFKRGGKGIEQRVVQALNTLVRYAEITALPNGTFAARRAA